MVDLGSHNGTFVNDIPVHDKLLEDGDTIKIGTSIFLFICARSSSSAIQTASNWWTGAPSQKRRRYCVWRTR